MLASCAVSAFTPKNDCFADLEVSAAGLFEGLAEVGFNGTAGALRAPSGARECPGN